MTVKVQSAARRRWEGICYMIAFHCHTVSSLLSFLFWDGYFFNWEGDIDTDRYEYIVVDICSQLDCERILGMEWYVANSTIIGKEWEGGRVIESH